MTVETLLYDALRLAGIVQLSGRTASTTEMADAFRALNHLIDGWNAEKLSVYAIERKTFALAANTASYTIATGATWDTARPPMIEAAHVIVGSPAIERPIAILPAAAWAAIPLKAQTSNFGPESLFYEALVPTGKVWVHPIPTASMSIALFVWGQLTAFEAQDDDVDFPAGYARAITYNLAVELANAPRFRRFAMDANVAALADRYKAEIQAKNAQLLYGLSITPPPPQEPAK